MLLLRGAYNDDIVQIGEGERLHIRTNHAIQGALKSCAGRVTSEGHDLP